MPDLKDVENRPGVTIAGGTGSELEVRRNGKLLTRCVVGKAKPYRFPVLGPTGATFTRS